MRNSQNITYNPPEYVPYTDDKINNLAGNFLDDLDHLPELKNREKAKQNFDELMNLFIKN